jgi:hypothetical protein
MTPVSTVILVLGLAVTPGVYFLMKKWLQDRKEVQLARLAEESRQFDAVQKMKRSEIFVKAIGQLPKVEKPTEPTPPLSNFIQ